MRSAKKEYCFASHSKIDAVEYLCNFITLHLEHISKYFEKYKQKLIIAKNSLKNDPE